MNINRNVGSLVFDGFNFLLLLLLAAAIVYPLYYMAIVSISDGLYVNRGDVRLLPIGINWEAYKMLLGDSAIMRAYLNTLLYTSSGTLINLTMTALCAYPLSRRKLFGRGIITIYIMFTMFFNGGLIPSFLVVYNLGMVDTIWAIVIPPAISVWYLIIMRTFFQNIPDELYESAHIDGANDWRIFIAIVLPLSMPVLATMTMFYAVGHWNSFFPALIYLNDEKLYPMQIIMRNIVVAGDLGKHADNMGGTGADNHFLVTSANIKYAVVIITILPILLIYPFIQKYFVKGVMIGSLKG